MEKNNGHYTWIIVEGKRKQKPKRVYPNLDTAIIYARKINMRPDTIHKVVAYRCNVCGGYHIGRSHVILTDKERERYINVDKKLKICQKIM